MKTAHPTSPPYFSILLPAYNAADTLPRAINSVLAQDFTDWELIIVDDGSRDATASKASESAHADSRIQLLTQPHAGCATARHTAELAAVGIWLMKLDADDELLPIALRATHDFITAHPGYDIYSANGSKQDAQGRHITVLRQPRFQTELSLSLSDLLTGPLIFGGAACINRAFAHRIGGFRPQVRCEDYDLWLRALAAGARHYYNPQTLYRYHTATADRMNTDPSASWYDWADLFDDLAATATALTPQQHLAARQAAQTFRHKADSYTPQTALLAAQTEAQAQTFLNWTNSHLPRPLARLTLALAYRARPLFKPFRLLAAHRKIRS